MISLVSGVLGGLGILSMISKRTVLGALLGTQLLAFGASLLIVNGGTLSDAALKGHSIVLLLAVSFAAQLGVGLALCGRLFYLKKNAELGSLRTMRN